MGVVSEYAKSKDPKIIAALPFFAQAYWIDYSGHARYWLDYYNAFNNDQKNSYYGKFIKQKVSITTGAQFPPFNLPTPEGKKLALKDILSKGKLTIVQFWASNS